MRTRSYQFVFAHPSLALHVALNFIAPGHTNIIFHYHGKEYWGAEHPIRMPMTDYGYYGCFPSDMIRSKCVVIYMEGYSFFSEMRNQTVWMYVNGFYYWFNTQQNNEETTCFGNETSKFEINQARNLCDRGSNTELVYSGWFKRRQKNIVSCSVTRWATKNTTQQKYICFFRSKRHE